jgi:uncharacterized protein YukE
MSTMLVEMPRRVWPAVGARMVRFPWSPARTVLTALSDARSTLSATLDTRGWNAVLATGWEGAYRDEFDDAYARLCAAAAELVERASARTESVIDAAGDANRDQVRENERAAGLSGVAVGPG